MQKVFTKELIIKLTFIFLVIQPLLDIKVLYDFEIFGVTIPTIIRLCFFAILFLLFIFNKRKLKIPIIYFILFCVYTALHLLNASNNYTNVLGKYSIISEIIYLIRLAIPMMFILFSYNYHFEFKKISKLFFIVAFIFASVIVITNIFNISYSSYSQSNGIVGNFLTWPFLSKSDIGYYDLATKGLFGYANPLSGLMCLILPILLYSFYKKHNLKKFVIIYSLLLSMLILGTRISSYMPIIILLLMLIVYIVLCKWFKTEVFDYKCLLYNIVLILLLIPFFINAPVTFSSDRSMSDDNSEYVLENKLLNQVQTYKDSLDSDLTDTEKQEIEDFIKENYKYFSINTGLAPDKYLYDDYLDFWLDYFIVSYENKNDTRDFEYYLYKHIYEHNNNRYDKFVGYGYSQNFNDEIVLERDGLYHFYTLGLLGLILFVAPYCFVLIYAIVKILTNFKNKMNLENVTYTFVIALLLAIAIISGNQFDFFIVNIFLSFICGQLLYNVKNIEKNEKLGEVDEKE